MSKPRDYRRCAAHGLRVIAEFEGIALCYVCVVCRFYAEMESEPLAAMLGCSPRAIAQVANKHGVCKSAAYFATHNCGRFESGHRSWNKGKKLPNWTRGRMAETQFKPGQRQGIAVKNWRPIGTILADPEGYLRIKVREGKKGEAYGFGNVKIWPLLNRHVWEQHHGPIPKGHAVIFRNGDRSDCDITNLELISRGGLMLRNSIHNLPPEIKEVIALKGAIRRFVTIRRKKAA